MELIGDQEGGLLMPQVLDDDLAKLSLIVPQLDPAVQNPWGLIDPRDSLKLDSPPGRNRLLVNLPKPLGRTSPERDEANPHPIEPIQMAIGRQLGVKDQLLGELPGSLLPELDEPKDFLILLILSQLSIGIAKHPFFSILGQEGQNPLLPPTPLRNIMLFHQGVFAVEGNGMEIQIKRPSPRKPKLSYGIKPQPHQPRIRRRINPTAIFREKRPFGYHIEPGKQSQPLVQNITHHVAVSGATKELEPQKGKDRLLSRNHLCPREPRLPKQPLQWNLSQIRDKQIQSPELGPKLADRQIQPVHIRNLCDLGPDNPGESFFVFSSGQPSKPFFLENQRDGYGANLLSALLQDPADVIDGQILLSQRDDLISETVGLRRSLGALLRGKEEGPIWMLTELVGQDSEASRGIAEAAGDLNRRQILNEVGPEGFVLPVSGIVGFEKVAGHVS
jgi:hypothetical protein